MASIKLWTGDITKLEVDAIVNAANKSLLGGGGVDGAIHRAAGPKLLAACRTLGGAETGEAKLTLGYQLPARWVIHTVGPFWNGGHRGEPEELAACYTNSLRLAEQHEMQIVAFPAISTGAYRFPKDLAAEIALSTCSRFLQSNPFPQEVIMVCFDDGMRQIYRKAAEKLNISLAEN